MSFYRARGFITLPILLAIIVALGLVVGGGTYWYESTRTADWYRDRGLSIPQYAGEVCTWECQAGYGHGDTCGSCVPTSNIGDVSDKNHTIVRWSFPQSFLDSFPKDFDLYVFLYVQKKDDPSGVNSSSIGDGWSAALGEVTWDPPQGTYKIYAQFQAVPHDPKRLCAIAKNKDCSPTPEDAAIIARGTSVKAESEFFTITQENKSPIVISLTFDAMSIPGMKTYTNSQYGFSFQYPKDMTLHFESGSGFFIAKVCTDNTCRVSVSTTIETDSIEVSQCGKNLGGNFADPAGYEPSIIDGISFNSYFGQGYSPSSDPNLEGYDFYKVYEALRDSNCVDLRTEILTSSNTLDKALQTQLNTIVDSFKFTDSAFSSVSGMSKYTDADFGFSFWYPSGWSIQKGHTEMVDADIIIYPSKNYSMEDAIIAIDKITSADRTVIDFGDAGGAAEYDKYYFDPATHTWMAVYGPPCSPSGGCNPTATTTANVSHNTMGGLHMLYGSTRYYTTFIPLSATKFLRISSPSGFDISKFLLTILATDPSVATPVSAAEQIKIIQAEKDAYANK